MFDHFDEFFLIENEGFPFVSDRNDGRKVERSDSIGLGKFTDANKKGKREEEGTREREIMASKAIGTFCLLHFSIQLFVIRK